MIETLKKRAHEESGFTLIELLVVIIILGILLAIAVPSYLGLKDRANKSAAQSNVRALVPDIEQYQADNYPGSNNDPDASTTDSGYTGITPAILKAKYDQSINASNFVFVSVLQSTYCVATQSGNWVGYKHGPAAAIGVTALASWGATLAGGTCP